jgi:glycine/D-amino acid oxidase-like deaminating enzyme
MRTLRKRVDPLGSWDPRPLWQAQLPPQPDRTQRALPEVVDLAVVGAGLAGSAAARRAARLGARVAVLEAEHVGWGASSRNGGIVHAGFAAGPEALVRRYGPEIGRAIFADSMASIDWTAATIAEEGIDADLTRNGHLELAHAPSHATEMEHVSHELTEAGLAARFVPRSALREEIGTDAYHGGLLIEGSAGLHPAKYVAGLAAAAERAGASFHEGVRVLRIRRQRDARFVVETSAGALLAKEVFVGTNGYTDGAAPALRRRILSIGSYIIATDPLPADLVAELSPKGRVFFDSKNFLYYWRITPDNRMLWGGRASFWPLSMARVARILQRGMLGVHPQLQGVRIAHAWGGQLGFTMDRLPHVGRSNGITYAMGCCGSGVGILPFMGDRAASWILAGGEAPALASVRFPLVPAPYEGRAWFLPLVGEYFRFRDWQAGREASPPTEPQAR